MSAACAPTDRPNTALTRTFEIAKVDSLMVPPSADPVRNPFTLCSASYPPGGRESVTFRQHSGKIGGHAGRAERPRKPCLFEVVRLKTAHFRVFSETGSRRAQLARPVT